MFREISQSEATWKKKKYVSCATLIVRTCPTTSVAVVEIAERPCAPDAAILTVPASAPLA
jgi:hypothetical protein